MCCCCSSFSQIQVSLWETCLLFFACWCECAVPTRRAEMCSPRSPHCSLQKQAALAVKTRGVHLFDLSNSPLSHPSLSHLPSSPQIHRKLRPSPPRPGVPEPVSDNPIQWPWKARVAIPALTPGALSVAQAGIIKRLFYTLSKPRLPAPPQHCGFVRTVFPHSWAARRGKLQLNTRKLNY